MQLFRGTFKVADIALSTHLKCLPDAKQEESAVAVVVRRLRTCILQFIAEENADKEAVGIYADVGIALLGFRRDRTFLLHGCKVLQQLGIRTADADIGITLPDGAKHILVETENHNNLKRREYLVLHISNISLLPRETETIESHHVALAEMLQGYNGGQRVGYELYALELIIHQIRLAQSLPQDIGGC